MPTPREVLEKLEELRKRALVGPFEKDGNGTLGHIKAMGDNGFCNDRSDAPRSTPTIARYDLLPADLQAKSVTQANGEWITFLLNEAETALRQSVEECERLRKENAFLRAVIQEGEPSCDDLNDPEQPITWEHHLTDLRHNPYLKEFLSGVKEGE